MLDFSQKGTRLKLRRSLWTSDQIFLAKDTLLTEQYRLDSGLDQVLIDALLADGGRVRLFPADIVPTEEAPSGL